MATFKKGLINRVKLTAWFQMMVIWSVFSAEVPGDIIIAYYEKEKRIKTGGVLSDG